MDFSYVTLDLNFASCFFFFFSLNLLYCFSGMQFLSPTLLLATEVEVNGWNGVVAYLRKGNSAGDLWMSPASNGDDLYILVTGLSGNVRHSGNIRPSINNRSWLVSAFTQSCRLSDFQQLLPDSTEALITKANGKLHYIITSALLFFLQYRNILL